ncbi:MAG: 7-carboxy-7-deazaguanine synthase QueE [Candidatus Omnitrophica bacterium]|nr:7-carboxy-7-deazaguanine synthase QueE [Candidatus Omnitrophota bacterium]
MNTATGVKGRRRFASPPPARGLEPRAGTAPETPGTPGVSSAVKPVGITEIFSSLQGEGPHVGEPHIFVRFEECNIHCAYCDELGKPAVSMGLEEVLNEVISLEKSRGPHAFVSLTGGEPLLYVNFLEPLAGHLKTAGFRIYLETSGILPKALLRIVGGVDVVAMDIKLKSITKEARNYFEEHREFLRLSKRAGEVFVKMVVGPEVDMDEFLEGVRLMSKESRETLLVLQGVTSDHLSFPRTRESTELDPRFRGDDMNKTLLDLQRTALQFLPNVRIIPRLHIAMGIR